MDEKCSDGLICSVKDNFCLRGTSGPGGCYGIGFECSNGFIHPTSHGTPAP
jgi:hypothetical protein